MICHLYPRFCIRAYVSVIPTGISMLVMLMATSISGSPQRGPGAELGLEVLLPGETTAVSQPVMIRGGSRIIPRRLLKISDPSAAGQLTAVQVQAEMEGDAINVRVSVIYNDISKQEWWKDKQEKIAGSYLIREGEAIRPAELWQFGIEPFELKVIGGRPIVFKPGEGPPVTNETTCLEVARLEKHLDGYRLWLKNTCAKNVKAFTVSSGSTGHGSGGAENWQKPSALAAGAISQALHLGGGIEQTGITIKFALFDDGSVEGDSKLADPFLAHEEGVRIQAPHVLHKIEATLRVDDTEIKAAFETLEGQLWAIPEAIDKQSALEFLGARFPSSDDKTLSVLYEQLKSGLYDARNIALVSMGQNGRIIRERAQQNDDVSTAKSLRQVLEDLKQTFVKIVSAHR